MPIDMDDLDHEVMMDIRLGNVARVDANQQKQIENLTKHVRVLWKHIEVLEKAFSIDSHSLTFKVGDASISLKRDGSVRIKGSDITVEGWGHVTVKAGSDLVLKGSKVHEN
ncbi:MAG: hypothetical protein ACXWJU_09515 [Hyphomicrobium sp.]